MFRRCRSAGSLTDAIPGYRAMLLEIPSVLNPAQLEKIHDILEKGQFQDGRLTAGSAAARVKSNEELLQDPHRMRTLVRILMSSLGHNATFKNAALPFRIADPIFARYQPGMAYGNHVDDPIMGSGGPRFRTDVSMTIFLQPPQSYDGGELVVRTSFGERAVKLLAGDAVLYPSSSLHHVAPVTRGERLVCLTWIQSYIKDAHQRELLYELNLAREHLLRQDPEAAATSYVDKSYANLLRMWSEL
jgi:PKHD-type hydroxylase